MTFALNSQCPAASPHPSMRQLTLYRNAATFVKHPRPGFEPVQVELSPGVELKPSQWGDGALLAYFHGVYGHPIPTAITLGWCRLVE